MTANSIESVTNPALEPLQVLFADGVWKLRRDSPGFSQRFEGHFSADQNTITAHWDKSTDGSHWEHDFDVEYTRKPS